MNTSIGLIANPASGKDIRRLIAHGTSLDNQAKVAMIRRILAGIQVMGPVHIIAMPDANDLVQRAADRMALQSLSVSYVDMPVTNLPGDSKRAARAMQDAGCALVIVLGGDGTVRVVADTDIPLLPISTGTNNVLPITTEGTLAGMAAGAIALGLIETPRVCYRHKWLEIQSEGQYVDRALVDVAIMRGQFTGARAVWDVSRLRQIIVTRASPMSIGISAIAGTCCPIGVNAPGGAALWIAATLDVPENQTMRAIIAPGVIEHIAIQNQQFIRVGESVAIVDDRPLVIALDGEREVVLNEPSAASVTLHDDGPLLVDLELAVKEMVAEKLFLV